MSVSNIEVTSTPVLVEKPWGCEEIYALVPGKFCGKVLRVRAGHALSLHYHRVKEEVIAVEVGTARLEIGDRIDQLDVVAMVPGTTVHIPPGRLHRISAVDDVVLLEASTTELDDVVRVADLYGREQARPHAFVGDQPSGRGGAFPEQNGSRQ
jgi:mannose-6-phosphate isomerase